MYLFMHLFSVSFSSYVWYTTYCFRCWHLNSILLDFVFYYWVNGWLHRHTFISLVSHSCDVLLNDRIMVCIQGHWVLCICNMHSHFTSLISNNASGNKYLTLAKPLLMTIFMTLTLHQQYSFTFFLIHSALPEADKFILKQ